MSADTAHDAACQSLLGSPVEPAGGAESSSSLTQDGGDYWPTVFWVLDLNIELLLH